MPGKKIHTNNDNVFNIDSEAGFYWAGFVAADGCIMEKGRDYPFVFKVALAIKDINHLYKLKSFLNATNDIKISKNKSSAELTVYSKDLCASLFKFGITPRKSLTYQIPEWLSNHKLFHHFIRGYFDGDGGISIHHNKLKQTEQYSINIRGTKQCLSSINANIYNNSFIKERTIRQPDSTCVIDFVGNRICEQFCDYIYGNASIYLDRKYNIYLDLLKINKQTDLYLYNTTATKGRITQKQIIEALSRNKYAKDAAKELNLSQTAFSNLVDKLSLRSYLKRTQNRKPILLESP